MNLPSGTTQNERKLISIFKQFVDKALVPVIRSNDSAMSQWQYFSSILNADTLDLSKLQIYVDVLSSSKSYADDFSMKKQEDRQKAPNAAFYKKKQQTYDNLPSEQPIYTFNPSKTFGGQRSRPAMFPLKQQEFSIPEKDPFMKKQEIKKPSNIPKLISNMQSILKTFADNQVKMEQATNMMGNNYGQYKYEERKYT